MWEESGKKAFRRDIRSGMKVNWDYKDVRSVLLRYSIRNTDYDDKQDIGWADEGDSDKLIKLVLGVKIFERLLAPTLYVQCAVDHCLTLIKMALFVPQCRMA